MYGHDEHLWGIILAGGEGKRLQPFIKAEYGENCPKQYCTFTGTRSMLRHTIDRAEKAIPQDRLLTVVTRAHLEYAYVQLIDQPAENIIVQPESRETAPGILYPLLHIYERDPDATVCLFPSDHFVVHEERFMAHVRFASDIVGQHRDNVVLLGIEPARPVGDYGWIVNGETLINRDGMRLSSVEHFLEKPGQDTAIRLFRTGALWNTLVVVSYAKVLLQLFESFTPRLYQAFSGLRKALSSPQEEHVAESLYSRLPQMNFSHEILSQNFAGRRSLSVSGVYWSDWGDASRVVSDLARFCQPKAVAGSMSRLVEPIRIAG